MVLIPAWLFNALTWAIGYAVFAGVLHLLGYRLIFRIERRRPPPSFLDAENHEARL